MEMTSRFKKIKEMIGETFTSVEYDVSEDNILLKNERFTVRHFHAQECCEDVSIEDINGDLNDLTNAPITMAEFVVNEDENLDQTYTFYKFATIKGYVNIRWFGTSNGYYSEKADVFIIDNETQKILAHY